MATEAIPQGERAGWLTALERAAAGRAGEGRRLWRWLEAELDPGAARPRRAERIESRGFESRRLGASYVLKNPRARTYLRLTLDEHFVWSRLDGRTIRELLADCLAEYGSLAPGRLVDLLARLRAAHMLAEPPRPLYADLADRLAPESWGQRAERALRSAVFAEWPLPGAGPLARLLYRAGGRLLFNRLAVVLLALVALAGPAAYASLLGRGGFELITTGGSFALGFFVFALANALATFAAEAGRALTTVHFGRQVRAGGLRMMLAMPTFYVDTRDIWLEGRRARLIVAAAGPAALLVTAGLAGRALLLAPDSPLADFLFKLTLLCYGTALFYLNPLVELDGYVLLSEWLEQPDLRARSFDFVRSGLLGKLLAGQVLDRQERGLAVFGVLAAIWTAYTVAGGLYFFGWRMVAGVQELWSHQDAGVRIAASVATLLVGSALALAAALIFVRLLTRTYLWAERQGLLAWPGALAGTAGGAAALVGLGALLADSPAIYRGLVAPPLLLVVVLFARRIARHYAGTLLRWFFTALALYAGLIFVAEELSALQALVQLDSGWAGLVDRAVGLAGPLVCLPFGIWLASLLTSRYRLPLGLLALGIGLYALHLALAEPRLAAAAAAAACGLLAGGVLVYQALARRPPARALASGPGPADDDAARLAEAVADLVAQVLEELVAQGGRLAAAGLRRRFNRTAARAAWELELRGGRLVEPRRRSLLAAGPVYRQALGLLLDEAAARGGRTFAERTLIRARDGLAFDRREVLDAWVLGDLAWGRAALGQSAAERAELLRFLRAVPLFAGLQESELEPVAAAFRPRQAPAGRNVVRQGAAGDEFFLIRSGTAEVIKREPGGVRRTVARLGEGDVFGELALLHDQPRNATVRAVTPLQLLVLGRADFDRLVRERFALIDRLKPALARQRLLAAMPLFAGLQPGELDALAARLEEQELPAGALVVRQGEPGDRFYLVREGDLVVSVTNEQRQPQPIARLGPGEYFGEIALLRDQPRSATVATLTPTRLFVLRKDDFDALLWGRGETARQLELVASRRRLDLGSRAGAQ